MKSVLDGVWYRIVMYTSLLREKLAVLICTEKVLSDLRKHLNGNGGEVSEWQEGREELERTRSSSSLNRSSSVLSRVILPEPLTSLMPPVLNGGQFYGCLGRNKVITHPSSFSVPSTVKLTSLPLISLYCLEAFSAAWVTT